MDGGRNNRVYRIDGVGEPLFLKAYFANANDPRDRFAAERQFYAVLEAAESTLAPRPLGWDPVHRLGLFSYIAGRKLRRGEADDSALDAALAFLFEVNTHRRSDAAVALGDASEACFSVRDHVRLVDRRVERMRGIARDTPASVGASTLVQKRLEPLWQAVREAVLAGFRGSGIGVDRHLSAEERCVSPSDFGFHNAIRRADGSLAFFDFEYAGWDDPAKLTCDFFCQPQVPVPVDFWDRAVSRILATLDAGPEYATRAALLLPAYQMKWCCIMLNDFLDASSARRAFAQPRESADAAKARQLAAAEDLCARIESALT